MVTRRQSGQYKHPLAPQSGFTLVELLIVVVVIAILAAITIVAYNGMVARANDARRMQDVSEIRKTLSLYKVDHGDFPPAAPNPGYYTWEISTDPGFLGSVGVYDNNAVFKDPVNANLSAYFYHDFPAGSYGCPAALGSFYVLWLQGMQSQTGAATMITNGCDSQTLFIASTLASPSNYIYFGFN